MFGVSDTYAHDYGLVQAAQWLAESHGSFVEGLGGPQLVANESTRCYEASLDLLVHWSAAMTSWLQTHANEVGDSQFGQQLVRLASHCCNHGRHCSSELPCLLADSEALHKEIFAEA